MNEKITCNGVEYFPATTPGEWTVWVMTEGWVMLGKPAECNVEGCVRISSAHNVRRYGNGSGIAGFIDQRDKLVLDTVPGDVIVPDSKVIFAFQLPDGWSPHA